MTVSVIIPTVGRASLGDALSSCAGADEIVVVVDEAHGTPSLPELPANAVLCFATGGDHGYTARTKGMEAATGTHLAFLDDDDVYTPGAIDLMRAAACDRPVIFRMDHPQHGILWREPVLEFGNVGTPMFLVPNDPGRLGVWAPYMPGLPEPGGDFTFISGCSGDPIWREEVTCIVRPDRGPSIAIVTPWLNHPEFADDYLAAVSVIRPTDELRVIDDLSSPPISFLLGIQAFVVDKQCGFARASNIGLAHATTDAVLFLNNDIRATSSDWLDKIRTALEPGVLVGAQLRRDPHGDIDGQPLPYLDGWCLAGMRDDLVELDGFDMEFDEPSYYGDNDLSLRARAAGMTLREVKVGLVHKLNGTARRDDPQTVAATLANRARFEARARDLLGVPA